MSISSIDNKNLESVSMIFGSSLTGMSSIMGVEFATTGSGGPTPPEPEWIAHFDNNDWEVPDGGDGTWTGSKWTSTSSPGGLDLVPKGSWYLGFLPSQIRVTGDDDGFSYVGLSANSNTIASFQSPGGVGVFQATADIDWDVEPYYDIESLHIVISGTGNTFGITNIEFYGTAAAEYTLTIGTATGSGSVLPTTGTTYRYNTGLTISGIAADGYEFSSWSGDTAKIVSSSSAVTTLVVPLNSNTNIQANFIATESSGVTETKSPSSDIDAGDWTIQGGESTMWESLSDANDATYILSTSSGSVAEVGLGAYTLDAGTYDVTATIRMKRWGTPDNLHVRLYGDSLLRGSELVIPVSSSAILNYTVTWENVALSADELSSMSLQFDVDNYEIRIMEVSLTIYTHVNRTWREFTSDSYWVDEGNWTWDGDKWTVPSNNFDTFSPTGIWFMDQKPLKMRMTIATGGFANFPPGYPASAWDVSAPGTYESDLFPYSDTDMGSITVDNRGGETTFSGIQFYMGPDLDYEWNTRAVSGTYWTTQENNGTWVTDHWEAAPGMGEIILDATSWWEDKRPVQIRITASEPISYISLNNQDWDNIASYDNWEGTETTITINIAYVQGDNNDFKTLYIDSTGYIDFNVLDIEFNELAE